MFPTNYETFILPYTLEEVRYNNLRHYWIHSGSNRIILVWLCGIVESIGFGSIEELDYFYNKLLKLEEYLCLSHN